MAKYSTKETVHEQDIITLTQEEYDTFNRIYKQALKEKIAKDKDGNLSEVIDALNLRYAILTDGTYRVEFVVERA